MCKGFGILRYTSGEVYEGELCNEQRNGEGVMTYGPGNGNRYVGSWLNSKKHGTGTFYFENGDIFEGEWSDGKMHGIGRYLFLSGDYFYGSYTRGKKDYGEYMFDEGTHYNGNWRNELFDGKGSMSYSNNEQYCGSWLLGMRHGRDALYNWPSGSQFQGTFEHDQMHKGLYRSAYDMGEFLGTFVDGRRCGLGLANLKDGSEYYGSFHNDQMSGIGIYKFL